MARADVGVVGAGLAGLLTAIELADAGATVHVLAAGHAATHWTPATVDLGFLAGARTPAAAVAQLARRAGYSFAAEKARRIYSSSILILRPSEDHEQKAIGFLEKYADQKANFTDCVSFALMHSHHLRRAFTFDRHFRSAGFETIPLLA